MVQGYKFNIMYFDLIDKSKVRRGVGRAVSWQRKCARALGGWDGVAEVNATLSRRAPVLFVAGALDSYASS